MKSRTVRQTHLQEIAQAQAQARQQYREREALDRELIRRMEDGQMLALDHIPWDSLEKFAAGRNPNS